MILSVSLPIPVLKTFDYLVPDDAPGDASELAGRRIRVPFGFRTATGIVVGVKSDAASDAKLKKAHQFLDDEPILSPQMMDLGLWLARRYLCSEGEGLFALLPPGGTIGFRDHGFVPEHHGEAIAIERAPALTHDQEAAVNRLHEAMFGGAHKVFVLRGVAAAGKTEVYMAAIKDAIAAGKSVLYLVPEIGLAAQAADMLRARFGESAVTLWHSDRPLKKRRESWWSIRRQECPIVVGARSAALVPLEHIGLIVVDEEQDTAFKEERKPRFHVRTVALERARKNGAVLIYGSATPSLETYFMTTTGEAELLQLNERAVAAAAPVARLVDLKIDKPRGGSLSSTLRNALAERLKRHEQTILFLNRRGFHRFLRCPHCGWVARCERCGVAFVHHKKNFGLRIADCGFKEDDINARSSLISSSNPQSAIRNPQSKRRKAPLVGSLACHLCGQHHPIPTNCPECGHAKLHAGGTGTERLSEEIREEFPWAKVVRWDSDSASKAGAHEAMYRDISRGDADVVIGTQVVAQGFNFPNVTLVGVIDADQPLHLPDFRAGERVFQHILQVGGRAGRELVTGDVIIQTRSADHYALKHVAESDFERFATDEIQFRKDLNYPPFSHAVLIRTEAKDNAKAEHDMDRFLDFLRGDVFQEPIGILGPTPAHGPKGKSKQLQCLLKVPTESLDLFLNLTRKFLSTGGGRLWIDVDPEKVF